MSRRVLTALAAVLAALLVSIQWQGRAETVAPSREAELRAQFRRPSGGIPYPADNPFSPAKYELGRMLFFEPLLSRSGSRACATCHNPGLSWGDGLPTAMGDLAVALPLRSPTLLNIAWISVLGWYGKFPDLEDVAFGAISGAPMSLDEETAKQRLGAIPGYVDAFRAAFGDGTVTRERVERAVATFERTLVSGPAPFDRWVEGDEHAIGEAARRGFALFTGRANCSGCHDGWAFTDGSFQDIGVGRDGDIGRARLFPSSVKLRYAFKVPTLRDVARRAPYMHDGSVPTLEAVIDLYDKGGIDRPSRSPKVRPLGLTSQEKDDLVAFLQTLTSAPEPIPMPILPR